MGRLVDMKSRKVYPNAPIALVSYEVELETQGQIEHEVFADVGRSISHYLPERKEILGHQITIDGSAPGEPEFEEVSSPRWSARDKRTHLSFYTSPAGVGGDLRSTAVFETTDYQGFERFYDLVSLVLDRLFGSERIKKVNRMGLRYLDEIRVPIEDDADFVNWGDWIAPGLLLSVQEVQELLLPRGFRQTSVVYQMAEDTFLRMRFGPGDGYEFSGSEEFRRELPTPGPYFLLDLAIDSTVGELIPAKTVLERLEQIHRPIREVFENLITEKLRNEVLESDN